LEHHFKELKACLKEKILNNLKNKNMDNINKKASGQNAIWDGPLDLDALPKGKGSSSGKYGMEISKAHCGCSSMKGPITQRAK
jgi:hypothetical protein